MESYDEHIPVLIVGGGLVGLTASLLFTYHGISSLLVERRAGPTTLPRARGINARSMEIYRELGLEEPIRAAGAALAPSFGWLVGATLTEALESSASRLAPPRPAPGSGKPVMMDSPTGRCMCPQDQLEPILLDAARQRGGDLRFRTELSAFTQDESGVTAIITDRDGGKQRTIHADYMLAADGGNSSVRRTLDIPMSGQGVLGHNINIYFQASLGELVRGREFSACILEQGERRGLLVAVNNTDRWILHIAYHPERGESPDDFTSERCVEFVRMFMGKPQLSVEIKSILPWDATASVAEHYHEGRIFIAGDAAHLMPPWGGMNGNTGIADAHNLTWKLATVLKDQATPELLATYDIERIPIARVSATRAAMMHDPRGLVSVEGMQRFFKAAVETGFTDVDYHYTSPAIIQESAENDRTISPGYHGDPGTRAPHAWVMYQDTIISTLNLFGRDFVLLTGPTGGAWCDAANALSANLGIELSSYQIGPGGDLQESEPYWLRQAEIQDDGALLVRPDGFVAWRSRGTVADPRQTLQQVLDRARSWLRS